MINILVDDVEDKVIGEDKDRIILEKYFEKCIRKVFWRDRDDVFGIEIVFGIMFDDIKLSDE